MSVVTLKGDAPEQAKSPLVLVPDPLQAPMPPPSPAQPAANGGAQPAPVAAAAQPAPVAPTAAPAAAPAPSSAAASAPAAPAKRAYPAPADMPTQQGPKGIRFDFNDGCRVVLPESDHPWRVRLTDLNTGNILFETELKAGRINSTKRYYVRFRLEMWQQGQSVFVHEYSPRPRGAGAVPDRNARRHRRLVSLRGEVPGAARLQAHLRHGRAAHSPVSRRLSAHHVCGA